MNLNEFTYNLNPASMSGDGALEHVGIRVSGVQLCEDCNQRFDSENALRLHVKYWHGNKVFRVLTLAQCGEACVGISLGGDEMFRLESCPTTAGELLQRIANALETSIVFLELTLEGNKLADTDTIDDLGLIFVRQDMGRTSETMFGVLGLHCNFHRVSPIEYLEASQHT